MHVARRFFLSSLAAVAAFPAFAKPRPAAKAQAGVYPHALAVPGGVARIALGAAAQRPEAHSGDAPLMVIGSAQGWSALAGIPLSATPGPAQITVQLPDAEPRTIDYTVLPKQYTVQRLKVDRKRVDLSPEDEARAEREREHVAQVIATFSQPEPASLAMRAPV